MIPLVKFGCVQDLPNTVSNKCGVALRLSTNPLKYSAAVSPEVSLIDDVIMFLDYDGRYSCTQNCNLQLKSRNA